MPRKIDGLTTIGGGPGMVSGSSVEPGSVTMGSSDGGLAAHLTSPRAHSAEAITYGDSFIRYFVDDVEGALDDLSALVPPVPPTLGNAPSTWLGSTLSGIPDWGVLGLNEPPVSTGSWDITQTANNVYPFYWAASKPGSTFTSKDVDPKTDPLFNIVDAIYTGGGSGGAKSGFNTLTPGGTSTTFPTWRIIANTSPAADYDVVSGVCFPADRGVLALLHWPTTMVAALGPATTETEVLTRCVAAILLGQGLTGSGACDGHSGGIFESSSGTPSSPYNFPGKAAGQFDLDELHTGAARVPGTTIPPAANPLAGRVRLLTDPTAQSFPISGVGIPIFGAASAGGGTDGNFFAYRLPYLQDYVNLNYTPTVDKPRFIAGIAPGPGVLSSGGGFPNFTKDFWGFQIARYRHRFLFTTTPGTPQRLDGSYALVHFKTETAFEKYVRDGVAPSNSDLWSVNLVNWSSISDWSNLVTATGLPSSCYHALRAEITEDSNGATDPTLDLASSLALLPKGGWNPLTCTVMVSGVTYFVPRDNSLPSANILSYAAMLGFSFWLDGVFDSTYLTSTDPYGADPPCWNAKTECPVFMTLASFGSTFTLSTPGPAPSFQRLEFPAPSLFHAGSWPSGSIYVPDRTSRAYNSNLIYPVGDYKDPFSFTTNAKARLFVRKTLVQGTSLPTLPIWGLTLFTGFDNILFHSTEYTSDVAPTVGNFLSAPTIPVATLYSSQRDQEEFFLDEAYRYSSNWKSLGGVAIGDQAVLLGPGLPPGSIAVMVPVRPNSTRVDTSNWKTVSWIAEDYHSFILPGWEAQVAGLPARNPLLLEGSSYPFPPTGILLYPKTDYATGYLPNLFMGVTQPDYSTATGEKNYVRAFNVGASAVGLKTFKLRIHGLQLSDFAFTGLGPGSPAIAVMVKVPGLTTWMDAGRPDGAGPSKQDVFIDGAGCKVMDGDTFDSSTVMAKKGYVYCQVKINVGPVAAFFANPEADTPVLVKVILKDDPSAKALDFVSGAPENGPTSNCRGLIGLSIVP